MKRMMEILDELMDASADERVKLNAEYDELFEKHYGWLTR
jgi:hypothetical protein